MTTSVRPANLEDALVVAANMREADRREVWASSRSTPEGSIRESLRISTHAWVGYYDGRPVCVFGVAPLNMVAGLGSPWLLGT
ncbi:hypothetical protein, partial [Ralstonia sp.]|uniref:hypothetical protein n=1 Tax=Ralstonia sp. TaxID=54061 RepID=UPI00257C86F0